MTTELQRGAMAGFSASGCSPSGRTHLDLFSGIGGFALAAQAAGYSTIGFSEIEPYACKILKRHWPDVPNFGDIRNIRGVRADLITGGFPCQPFSLAGKQRGAADDRHLWPEMCRVIAEARPAWVLGENVPGIIGMELDNILSDLEAIGYAAWPLVVPACAVDARHRRDRLWLVAYSDQGGIRRSGTSGNSGHAAQRGEDVADAEHDGRRTDQPGRQAQGRTAARRNGQDVAKPNGARSAAGLPAPGHREEGHAAIADDDSGGCCRWPDEAAWFAESGMGRVAHGIPNRAHRLKGLGNAIVPQVAETLLRMMARMENAKHIDRHE